MHARKEHDDVPLDPTLADGLWGHLRPRGEAAARDGAAEYPEHGSGAVRADEWRLDHLHAPRRGARLADEHDLAWLGLLIVVVGAAAVGYAFAATVHRWLT